MGAGNVFVHLDTYHMNIEEAGMVATAGHLGYIHLSESNRGVPGRGTLDWDATFVRLTEIGYDGPMTVESFVQVAPEIGACLAILRPVAERKEDVGRCRHAVPARACARRRDRVRMTRPGRRPRAAESRRPRGTVPLDRPEMRGR